MYNLFQISSDLLGILEGKRQLGDPAVDGRIILRRTFRKWDMGVWTGPTWLRIGTVDGTCECGD